MSSTPDLSPLIAPDDVMRAPAHDPKSVWRCLLTMSGILLVAYLLLQNPYWVPGGDSDFYVAIARNLVKTGVYEYNGLPVAISPPGWPIVMAWVLKISPTFTALKLTTMVCMLASLVVSYFIALRFVSPRVAAFATVLTGILNPVYSLTYFLHSEGLYCLLSAVGLLLAFRIREKAHRNFSKGLLFLICIAIPFVRWAGVFQLLPIVGVLMSGKWGSWQNRKWIVALICGVLIVGTWYGTRKSLELTAEQQLAIKEAGGGSVMETDAAELPAEGTSVVIAPVSNNPNQTLLEEYGQRFLRSGKWFSWLIWQPTRFASVNKWLDTSVTVLGWSVILVLGYLVVVTVRKGELIWLSLALYCGALCMNWPNPNSRYFVPVAPQIVVGILLSLRLLRDVRKSDFADLWQKIRPSLSYYHWSAAICRKLENARAIHWSFETLSQVEWPKWFRRAFVYSLLLGNLALFSGDMVAMRASRFYETFEAGQHKDLVNIAHYLMELPPPPDPLPQTLPSGARFQPRDGQIVINERYENLGRIRFSKAGMRAMVLLTDRDIKSLDPRWSKNVQPPFSGQVAKFVRQRRANWLLVQAPAMPWRVWHFRLPESIQNYVNKPENEDQPPSGGWTLYRYDPALGNVVPEPIPSVEGWPTRVPGL